MFCPQCGSTQSDELKYCKTCGANLQALRQVMATRGTGENFDPTKTWVAEMFMTRDEKDRVKGITPELKRQREIKAGIITAASGLGLMILLFVLMSGIIAGGRISDAAAQILSRLWIVGIIPLLVGGALLFNGLFVSKSEGTTAVHETDADNVDTTELGMPAPGGYLAPADTNDLASSIPFSVTDNTTRHLEQPVRRKEG